MSWSKLNAAEVQAVRMGLHLSIPEAAEWVAGHTNPRSWQRYETGERDVPLDIDAELYVLSQIAEDQFEYLHEQVVAAITADSILTLKYYKNIEEWQAENPDKKPVLWRIHQSVASRIFREFGSAIELI